MSIMWLGPICKTLTYQFYALDYRQKKQTYTVEVDLNYSKGIITVRITDERADFVDSAIIDKWHTVGQLIDELIRISRTEDPIGIDNYTDVLEYFKKKKSDSKVE